MRLSGVRREPIRLKPDPTYVGGSGIKNILTKCLGSHNPHNAVKAAFNALQQLQSPEEFRKKHPTTTESQA